MAENRLVEVTGHWLPRMEVAGIPSTLSREVIAAAGDWPNWCRAWSDAGAEHMAMGQAALAAGHQVTAGEAFTRAALLYHFAQFMFFDDPDQKAAATAQKLRAYQKAAPLLQPPAQPVEIPFEGGTLKAYLRQPQGAMRGLVILIPGSDSTKEEFPGFEAHFLRRGLGTLAVDGPGQGEGRAFGPLRPDITTAIAATVAHLRDDLGIHTPLGLAGMAYGGHLVLRAAAGVPELSAVVSINGFFDLGQMWEAFPQVYRDNMRYALGGTDAADTQARALGFTLRDAPAPAVPALVLHGGLDKVFPADQARAQADWAGARAEMHLFPRGNHVCNNIPYIYRPLVADWLAEKLAG